MLKLLICLFGAVLIAAVMLQLRQQRMDLSYQSSRLHRKIEQAQTKLWNQQLQIGIFTAPNAIQQTIRSHKLELTPSKPVPAGNPADSPDADEASPPSN